MVKIRMKIRKFSRNFPRLRKFIPATFLNGPIRERFYSRKFILVLGDRESLSRRKFIPAKVYTDKVDLWKTLIYDTPMGNLLY